MNVLTNKYSFAPTTLTSPQLAAGSQCLIFYYYAYGEVTLQVNYVVNKNTILWSQAGSKDEMWKKVELSLPTTTNNYKVNFQFHSFANRMDLQPATK